MASTFRTGLWSDDKERSLFRAFDHSLALVSTTR